MKLKDIFKGEIRIGKTVYDYQVKNLGIKVGKRGFFKGKMNEFCSRRLQLSI